MDQRRQHAGLGEEQADVDEQRPGGELAEILRGREPGEDEVEAERQGLRRDEADSGEADPAHDRIGKAAAGIDLGIGQRRGIVFLVGRTVLVGGQRLIPRFSERSPPDSSGQAEESRTRRTRRETLIRKTRMLSFL